MINENEARILSDGFRIYNDDGSSDVYDIIPPSPSLNHRGGIIAGTKTEDDTVEIKIGEDGKGYVPTYPVIIDALSKTNVEEYTPTEDYHPATKKYVDDTVNDSINSLEPCSWSEVTDKPFGEEITNYELIFENVEMTSATQSVEGLNTDSSWNVFKFPMKVIYNNTEYIITQPLDGQDVCGDSNLSEYPFSIEPANSIYWGIKTANIGDVISMYIANTEINPIDEKYIPDTIQRTSSVLTQANTNSASGSYSPTEDTDLTTKGYVDDSIEAIPSDILTVNVTGNDTDGYLADKTYDEIVKAYEDGKIVNCIYNGAKHDLDIVSDNTYCFIFNEHNVDDGLKLTQQLIFITSDDTITRIKSVFDTGDISTLATTNKTIVGAINEINSSLTSSVSSHNTSTESHSDIRILISTLTTNLTNLTTRLNALADSDDETLDQMSEVVALIKNNASLIEGITTSKVNVKDIIDNLTTDSSDKPLSAAQGVVLKALIDAIIIPTLLSQLSEDSTHRLVTDDEKELWNNKSDFSGNYNDLTNIPTFSIEKHTDGLIYIFINGVPTGTGLDINTISDTTEE